MPLFTNWRLIEKKIYQLIGKNKNKKKYEQNWCETMGISRLQFHLKDFSTFSNNERFQESNAVGSGAKLVLKGYKFKSDWVLIEVLGPKAANDIWVENCMI